MILRPVKRGFEEFSKFQTLNPGEMNVGDWVWAPLYVALRKNQKLIAVKSPFEPFTEEDHRKWVRAQSFYYPRENSYFAAAARLAKEGATYLDFVDRTRLARDKLPPSDDETQLFILKRAVSLYTHEWNLAPAAAAVFAIEILKISALETFGIFTRKFGDNAWSEIAAFGFCLYLIILEGNTDRIILRQSWDELLSSLEYPTDQKYSELLLYSRDIFRNAPDLTSFRIPLNAFEKQASPQLRRIAKRLILAAQLVSEVELLSKDLACISSVEVVA